MLHIKLKIINQLFEGAGAQKCVNPALLHTHFCDWTKAKLDMHCLTDFFRGLGSYGRNQYLAVEETLFCYRSSVTVNSKSQRWEPI
jgi:hypothetical protein